MSVLRSGAFALAGLLSTGAALAQGTISSGTTFFSLVGTPFSTGTGNANLLFGSSSGFASEQLTRYSWSYNQGTGTSNRPFSTLDTPTQTYVGNVATLTWNNAGAGSTGFARWNAVLTITLTELAAGTTSTPGAARVDSVLTFTSNAANSAAVNFSVFHELDLDIIGTNVNAGPNDTYRVVDASAVSGRAFDSSAGNYAEFIANGAARYEFNTGSALRTKTGAATGTGSGSLATAAGTAVADWASTDGAAAFQWTPTLAPGQSTTITSSFTINAPIAAVPEPATWLSLLAGGAALLAARRRRG